MQHLTEVVNEIVSKSNSKVDDFSSIITLIKVNATNHFLEAIQETIVFTRASITNNKLLSMHEINTIRTMLEDQGIRTTIPGEALNLVLPKIAINKDNLSYILKIPQMEEVESTILEVYPLIVNETTLTEYSRYLVKRNSKLFTTTHPEEYIQREKFLSEYYNTCISNLVLGTTSNCSTRRETGTEIKEIAEGIILINNAKTLSLKSDCGPDDRTINGNMLIKLSNCSMAMENKTFTSKSIIAEAEPF